MAKTPTLSLILAEVKKTNSKLSRIERNVDKRLGALEKRMDSLEKRMGFLEKRMSSVEKRMDAFEKDIKKVLQCVSYENADEFPSLKSSHISQKHSVAAKGRS